MTNLPSFARRPRPYVSLACAYLAWAMGGTTLGGYDSQPHPFERVRPDHGRPSTVSSPPRSTQVLSVHHIRQALEAYLAGELSGRINEIHVALGFPDKPMKIPQGRLSLNVTPKGFQGVLGRRTFDVAIRVNDRLVENMEAIADISGVLDVVVPVRLLKTGERIEADDVTKIQMTLLDLRQPFAAHPKDVIGKAAARPLPPQAPILLTSLMKPHLVRKGDRVTIEARGEGLSIQTIGITKTSGQLDDIITVTNSDSGKDVQARVVAAGVVRVEF